MDPPLHPYEIAVIEELARADHARWGATPWSDLSAEDQQVYRQDAERTLALIADVSSRFTAMVPKGAKLTTLLTVEMALPIHGPTTTTHLAHDLLATVHAWGRRRGVHILGSTRHLETIS